MMNVRCGCKACRGKYGRDGACRKYPDPAQSTIHPNDKDCLTRRESAALAAAHILEAADIVRHLFDDCPEIAATLEGEADGLEHACPGILEDAADLRDSFTFDFNRVSR